MHVRVFCLSMFCVQQSPTISMQDGDLGFKNAENLNTDNYYFSKKPEHVMAAIDERQLYVVFYTESSCAFKSFL